MDAIDRQICEMLDQDARMSLKHIASRVQRSESNIARRINSLVDRGEINHFITVINSMKLGYQWYRTFIKFQSSSKEQEQELIDWLKTRVSWMTGVEGMWDLNTGIFLRDPYEYRDFFDELQQRFASFIGKTDVAIVTQMYLYPRAFRTEKKSRLFHKIGIGPGEQKDIVEVDGTDMRILNCIEKRGDYKTIDVARNLNIPESTIRYRIKHLEKTGVIVTYKPFFNVHEIGLLYLKLHVKLRSHDSKQKKRLIEYIHQHPRTVYLTELVGGDDIECEYQVKTFQQFYADLKHLRHMFESIIQDYFFMHYTNEYQFSYLPNS